MVYALQEFDLSDHDISHQLLNHGISFDTEELSYYRNLFLSLQKPNLTNYLIYVNQIANILVIGFLMANIILMVLLKHNLSLNW